MLVSDPRCLACQVRTPPSNDLRMNNAEALAPSGTCQRYKVLPSRPSPWMTRRSRSETTLRRFRILQIFTLGKCISKCISKCIRVPMVEAFASAVQGTKGLGEEPLSARSRFRARVSRVSCRICRKTFWNFFTLSQALGGSLPNWWCRTSSEYNNLRCDRSPSKCLKRSKQSKDCPK